MPSIIANISLLSIVTLSQNCVQASTADASSSISVVNGLLAVYD